MPRAPMSAISWTFGQERWGATISTRFSLAVRCWGCYRLLLAACCLLVVLLFVSSVTTHPLNLGYGDLAASVLSQYCFPPQSKQLCPHIDELRRTTPSPTTRTCYTYTQIIAPTLLSKPTEFSGREGQPLGTISPVATLFVLAVILPTPSASSGTSPWWSMNLDISPPIHASLHFGVLDWIMTSTPAQRRLSSD